MASVGRNDPCPCGSGKKFKRCCALARPTPAAPVEAPEHALDRELVPKLFRFGKKRFGGGWNPFEDLPSGMEINETTAQFLAPWAAYEARFEGRRRLVDLYLEHERRVTSAERAWLVAQQASSLSVWEVVRVERDHGLHAVDLLTGDERFVRERLATRQIVNRDAVLARVVDLPDYSVFCGMYPHILHPELAADVVRIVRRELGRKKCTRERLREEESTDIVIEVWEEAVAEMLRPKPVPKLSNTDGDELLLTIDRYSLEPKARQEVVRRLATLEGAVPDDEAEDGEWTVDFQRRGNAMNKAMDNTIVGVARVTDTAMKLETNSLRRADHLRRRVEAACGWLVTHRAREHSDPQTILERRRLEPNRREPAPAPDVEIEIVRDYKNKHYEAWLDTGVPALGNRTPREAAGNPRLRTKLDLILKELENHESRLPERERFDVALLRAKLGTDAKATGAAGPTRARARKANATSERA